MLERVHLLDEVKDRLDSDARNLSGGQQQRLCIARAWYRNFTGHWNFLKKNYDERFFRMWTYYLSAFMGGFQSRNLQVWQVVMSNNHKYKEYIPVR